MYRQGDVLIVKAAIPRGAEVLSTRVVVYGETTGHAHRIEGNGELVQAGATMFLAARDGVRLVHEEHDTIEIPEGEYRIVRQREYDEKEIRYVSD